MGIYKKKVEGYNKLQPKQNSMQVEKVPNEGKGAGQLLELLKSAIQKEEKKTLEQLSKCKAIFE